MPGIEASIVLTGEVEIALLALIRPLRAGQLGPRSRAHVLFECGARQTRACLSWLRFTR